MKNNSFHFSSRLRSFRFAWKGIRFATGAEANLRIHWLAIICVIGLGWWLDLAVTQWALLAVVSGFVVVTELLNTALEMLCDFASPQRDKRIGRVKDVAAGAVLVAAATALAVGCLIFLPALRIKMADLF